MAISTEINKMLVDDVFNMYSNAEHTMLQVIAKRIKKGVISGGWDEAKLRDIQVLRSEIESILNYTNSVLGSKVEQALVDAYQKGANSARLDFRLPKTALSETQVPALVQRLVLETNNLIAGTNVQILRDSLDVYRDVIAETASGVVTGVETRLQIAQKSLNKFAEKGITSFVDKAGRRWEMASYAEMATRTTTARAAIQGHIDRQTQAGRDLVIVSSHGVTCPICRPWEGKVLSISGNTPGYTSLESAKSAGLFHPNCKHTLTGYIQGLTKVGDVTEYDQEKYKIIETQRYNERQIRKWKRIEAVAINDKAKVAAQQKIALWQAKQRQLLKDTDIRRKYNRESLNGSR
jgi:hypothetical protein